MSKPSLFIAFALFGLISCANKEDASSFAEATSQIESLNQVQSSKTEHESSFALNNEIISSGQSVVSSSQALCQLISNKDLANPFEFEEHFSENVDFNYFKMYINQIEQLSSKCLSVDMVLDHYPLSIVKFNLADNNSLYGFFNVDDSNKIRDYYFMPSSHLSVDHLFVDMSDGEKLSSLLFKKDNTKKTTVIIKTPYLHTSPISTYIQMATRFLNKGFNVLMQSNRGSHASSGVFKWLHEKNIDDSRDSINWITSQEFSNQKVISYGVSYDGYNALAAAASNAEGLVSTIACSAPSKAETDSFTAGRSIESSLLKYIAERENMKEVHLFSEKVDFLQTKETSFEDFDNILYGRDISDWNDLIVAQNSGSLDDYLKDRSVLEKLKDSNVPIFHVGGTDNDQDGRDTYLAYEYLKKESYRPKKNFFYLHHKGHGCGDFFNKDFGNKFLEGNIDSLVNEYRDLSNGGVSKNIEEDFSAVNVKLFGLNTVAELSNRTYIDEYAYLDYKGKAEEDITINGSPKLKLNISSSLWKSSLIISLFNTASGEWQIPHSMASGLSRTSLYLKDSAEGELSVTLPPMKFKLKKGDSLMVRLSLDTRTYIDFFRVERSNYYERNSDSGNLEIEGLHIDISLPVEENRDLIEAL